MQLILGSQSPRRKEIMGYFNLPFIQIDPAFDEDSIFFEGDPESYVKAISRGKAAIIAERFPNDLILTADTTVYQNGQVFNKPADEAEFHRTLTLFQGVWHSVYTGLTLQKGSISYQGTEKTDVLFNPLDQRQMELYEKNMPWKDRAGGYTCQGSGSLLIEEIRGCYYNCLGLPVNLLYQLLLKFDIDLWTHLKN